MTNNTVLDSVFQRAEWTNNPGICPNIDRASVNPSTSVCYYNYTKANPSTPYIVRDALGKNMNILDCFCVAAMPSGADASPSATSYYLAPPTDSAGVTNVEYLISPSPNATCNSFPQGPGSCAQQPDGYCRDPSGQVEGLSCQPNVALGVKFGACLPDGQGGSLQGWQCARATWDCVPNGQSRSCRVNPNGTGQYSTQHDCLAANCENCADKSFCYGFGVCNQNVCSCFAGFTGASCQCPPKGSNPGYCTGCDWPNLSTLQQCGSSCDTYCGNQGKGWECLCACGSCNGCTGPCKPSGKGCFRAGSQVLLHSGKSKSVEFVAEADVVRSGKGTASEVGNEKVINTLKKGAYWYGVNDEIPFFTSNHPFMTWEGYWVALDPEAAKEENPDLDCRKLVVGMKLQRWNGSGYEPVTVKRITSERLSKDEKMHGLYLLGEKSYHVNGYVVKMNYPMFTLRRLQQGWEKLTLEQKKKIHKHFNEIQSELATWTGSWLLEAASSMSNS